MILGAATWIFGLLWIAALGLLTAGAFALVGPAAEASAGSLLSALGLPWNLVLRIFPPEPRFWLTTAAPGLNMAILLVLYRLPAWRR